MDGKLDDDKTRSKQPVITDPHTYRPSDEGLLVGGACWGKDQNASLRGEKKKLSTPQNSCIAIGRESLTNLHLNGKVVQEVDKDICPAVVFVGLFFWR